MKMFSVIKVALFTLLFASMSASASQREVQIDSIEQLLEYAKMDSVCVTMKRGVYKIDDAKMASRVVLQKHGSTTSTKRVEPTPYPVTCYLHFDGNGSTYNLEGVVIKLGGELHTALDTPHLYEVFVTGNNNLIKGLNVEDEDENIAPKTSAILLHVMGDDNTLDGVSILVKGSTPYGYGHLLGKGSPSGIVALKKHSSLLVSGVDTKLLNCRVITRAYGHGIVMQGAVNTYIENCYVEGKMRTTDDMLAEREGAAYDSGFKSIYPPGVIEPNRMIALSEDGIRTYPFGPYVNRLTQGVTVVNTTVKHMRSGFDLGAHIPPTLIKNCTTIECQEKGYSVGSNGVIIDSRGDAKYGPLLTFQRADVENCYVELELMSAVSDYKVTRMAEINGRNHHIKFTNHNDEVRGRELPIVFGESFWSDVHIFRLPDEDPAKFSGAYNVTLHNETGMPTEFKRLSGDCHLTTNGAVAEDFGQGNMVEYIRRGTQIYNRGVAGNTTFDLLERVYSDVVALTPDLTIVMVGTNDMLNSRKVVSYDDYRANLIKLTQMIQSHGSDVMLISPLPADSEYLFERHDKSKYAGHPSDVMQTVSRIVEDVALNYDCHFVDLHKEFVDRNLPKHNKDIYIRNERNSRVKDGVHPTAAGYTLIGETLWSYFVEHNLVGRYRRIVCLGDSITKGTGASGAGTIAGENYPSYLNLKLNN